MVSKIGELYPCWWQERFTESPVFGGMPSVASEILGTGLSPSLQEFERFIVASALEIMRQARIDRVWKRRFQLIDLF